MEAAISGARSAPKSLDGMYRGPSLRFGVEPRMQCGLVLLADKGGVDSVVSKIAQRMHTKPHGFRNE